jgi:tRNA A58 N-methylase Trm61
MKSASVDWSRVYGLSKLVMLFRCYGPGTTLGVIGSIVEDLYLCVFDRRYGVRTSGYISLSQTTLEESKIKRGHRYRPVNAWALQRLLNRLALPKEMRFVDIGCGLGRACLIASHYGFSRVRGVDIVPEFCACARRNAEAFYRRESQPARVEVVLEDAVEYSRHADDDIVFLYNPVPVEVLTEILNNLTTGSSGRRPTYVIYSERIIETSRTLAVLTENNLLCRILVDSSWGQAFYVFKLKEAGMRPNTQRPAMGFLDGVRIA